MTCLSVCLFVCLCFSEIGWRARLTPRDHPASEFEFDVIVGADGRRNTLHGEKSDDDDDDSDYDELQ